MTDAASRPSSPSGATGCSWSRSTAPTSATPSMPPLPRASPPRWTSSTPTRRSRSGVLAGAGKGFCSGMDLKAFVAGESPVVEGRGFAGITQRAADKPLIAAVEGFAVAGGLEVAIACDLIVAARGARLGIPEVKRSLVAAGGGLLRLPRMLPRNVAMEMALTGDFISAERAAELGLVNRLADAGGAVDAALELAGGDRRQRAARAGGHQAHPDRVRGLARRRVLRSPGGDRGPVRDSEDAREGATAFAEKRAPQWKGLLGGLAPGGGDDHAAAPVVAVLTQVDALPGAEREPSAHHRQHQRRPQQRRLDVGGHVVVAFERVRPVGSAVGHGLVKPGGEVAANIGRRVLIERQRRRGVLDEEMEHPHAQLGQLG